MAFSEIKGCKYICLDTNVNVIRPTKLAQQELGIPLYRDFYLHEFEEVVENEGLIGISKPVHQFAKTVKRDFEIEYILEIISFVKKQDKNKIVNWNNTDAFIRNKMQYLQFKKTPIAKAISAKYDENQGKEIFTVMNMNDVMKCAKEENEAFEKWKKKNLIIDPLSIKH